MGVKIHILGKNGHETIELSKEEAEHLIEAEEGRYFIIDSKTKQILREIKLEEGQELMMIPIVSGG